MQKFVVVIPSYNNAQWCEQNLSSVVSQDYSDFRVIYTDDCSKDNTAELVEKFIETHDLHDRVKFIKNDIRKGAMHNLYDMIHSCEDNEVIVTLDGDDWLAHPNVLNKLNDVYSNSEIWMSYGSYVDFPGMTRGCCKPYNDNEIKSSSFRKLGWRASHLRSFYVKLFKKIKKEDFYDPQGKWLDMAWDLSFMLPLLELSGHRHKYIHDILYIYNNENPISDHVINQSRQGAMDRFIRMKPKYSKIESL